MKDYLVIGVLSPYLELLLVDSLFIEVLHTVYVLQLWCVHTQLVAMPAPSVQINTEAGSCCETSHSVPWS